MISNLSKNVICVKEIPSNLIEEAFFILKISENKLDDKYEKKRKEIILAEINEIIKEYSTKFQSEKEIQKKKDIENRRKLRKLRWNALLIVTCLVAMCIIVAKII